jgi:hypothetical protein
MQLDLGPGAGDFARALEIAKRAATDRLKAPADHRAPRDLRPRRTVTRANPRSSSCRK